MKTLIVLALFLLLCNFCYSQDRLDSNWQAGNHHFRVLLERDSASFAELNTKLSLYRNKHLLFTDSLFCSHLSIELEDVNGDTFPDLKIFQSTGARANETFNLYLFQRDGGGFKKVTGFEQWPNMTPTKSKGILVSTILTGTVGYHFFRINDSGELIDLNVSEEDSNLDGKEYLRGLRKARKLLDKSKKSVQHQLDKMPAD
jgi:hypothetical protein